MKNKIVSTFTITILFCITAVNASDNKFIEHAIGFDKAQEQLKLKKVIPYLSNDISINITKCDNTVDHFDKNKFKETYSSIAQHGELLSMKREVTKLENCDNGKTCTIHSKMNERVVAYEGKYDKTTISTDITKLVTIGGKIDIESIKAVILCN